MGSGQGTLIKKILKNWFFRTLARSWFWGMLFSIQILIEKWIEKLIFSDFGKILVLGNAFFYSNSNWKMNWKIDFFNFWQDLGFGVCFFLFKFWLKKLFQILARSWFWWMFFLLKFELKKYWKIDFFNFWQDLGFDECFFHSNSKKYWKIVFFRYTLFFCMK